MADENNDDFFLDMMMENIKENKQEESSLLNSISNTYGEDNTRKKEDLESALSANAHMNEILKQFDDKRKQKNDLEQIIENKLAEKEEDLPDIPPFLFGDVNLDIGFEEKEALTTKIKRDIASKVNLLDSVKTLNKDLLVKSTKEKWLPPFEQMRETIYKLLRTAISRKNKLIIVERIKRILRDYNMFVLFSKNNKDRVNIYMEIVKDKELLNYDFDKLFDVNYNKSVSNIHNDFKIYKQLEISLLGDKEYLNRVIVSDKEDVLSSIVKDDKINLPKKEIALQFLYHFIIDNLLRSKIFKTELVGEQWQMMYEKELKEIVSKMGQRYSKNYNEYIRSAAAILLKISFSKDILKTLNEFDINYVNTTFTKLTSTEINYSQDIAKERPPNSNGLQIAIENKETESVFIDKFDPFFFNDKDYIYDGIGDIVMDRKFNVIRYNIYKPTRLIRNVNDESENFYFTFQQVEPLFVFMREKMPDNETLERQSNKLRKVNDAYLLSFEDTDIEKENGSPGAAIAVGENTFIERFVNGLFKRYSQQEIDIGVRFTFTVKKSVGQGVENVNGVNFSYSATPNEQIISAATFSFSVVISDFLGSFDDEEQMLNHVRDEFFKTVDAELYDVLSPGYKIIRLDIRITNGERKMGSNFNINLNTEHNCYDYWKDKIFIPQGKQDCFMKCFYKHIGKEFDQESQEYIDLAIMASEKNINIRLIKQKEIPAICDMIEKVYKIQYNVKIYKYKDEEIIRRPIYQNCVSIEYGRHSYAKLINISNHLIYFSGDVLPINSRIFTFDDLSNKFTTLDQFYAMQERNRKINVKPIKPPKQALDGEKRFLTNKTIPLTEFNNHFIWDCEAFHTTTGFQVYQVSFLPLKNLNKDLSIYIKGNETLSNVNDIKSTSFWGVNAMVQFVDFLKEMYEKRLRETRVEAMKEFDWRYKKIKETENMSREQKLTYFKEFHKQYLKQKGQVYLWAHNSSRFDNILLVKENVARENITSVINSNGLLLIELFDYFIFKDFYRFISAPLRSICKDYKLKEEFAKTEFCHEFIDSVEKLDYVGELPGFTGIKNLKDTVEEYAKNDVISLGIVFRITCDAYYELTSGYYLWEFFTAPNFSNAFSSQKINEKNLKRTKVIVSEKPININLKLTDNKSLQTVVSYSAPEYRFDIIPERSDKTVYICSNHEIDKFIRKSIRGGRVYPNKRRFISGRNINGYTQNLLLTLDASSLYPSAMASYKYPTGQPYWVDHTNFPSYLKYYRDMQQKHLKASISMTRIKENETTSKIHILYVRLSYPVKNITFPLLCEKDGTAFYDCNEKTIVVTNIDLEEAVKYNFAYVEEIYGILEWPSSDYIYKDFITPLFNQRAVAKKEGKIALSNAQKTIMNSAYGYCIKKVIYDKVFIAKTREEFHDTLMTEKCLSFERYGENMRMDLKLKEGDVMMKSPSHLGVFILAYSKKLMNSFIDEFDGFGLRSSSENERWNKVPYYTDTDSVYIDKPFFDIVKNKINPWGIKWCYGFGEKAQLTNFHDDIDETMKDPYIINGYFMMPKVKFYDYEAIDPKTGERKVISSITMKGVRANDKISGKEISEEHFRIMCENQPIEINSEKWGKQYKNAENAHIKISPITKVLNRKPWGGRDYCEKTERYYIKSYAYTKKDKLRDVVRRIIRLSRILKILH